MTAGERGELLKVLLAQFDALRLDNAAVREDMARGFRDMSRREDETRERVVRMEGRIEGGLGMVRWLGPSGVAALIIGLLIQAGVIR